MKNIHKYLFLFLTMFFYKVEAQQVTKTDTISGTPLTVSMDRNISDALEKLEENCALANARVAERKNTNNVETETRTSTVTEPKRDTKVVANRALTTAEICRQNPRILGVKIQLAVVKSNEEANEVKAYFRRRFPSIKVETDASLRPNYKILAGSYFNKGTASGDLARIRQYFKSAIPIQYRVFCAEAK